MRVVAGVFRTGFVGGTGFLSKTEPKSGNFGAGIETEADVDRLRSDTEIKSDLVKSF